MDLMRADGENRELLSGSFKLSTVEKYQVEQQIDSNLNRTFCILKYQMCCLLFQMASTFKDGAKDSFL